MPFTILIISNGSNSITFKGRISMDIYSQNKTPYFYIIEHKATGIKYAGAKWAKDANPDNFMTESGYKTSSNTIKNIIATEGLDIFKINEIILLQELNSVPFGCQTIDEYESWFLESNKCCESDSWYNRTGPWKAAFGTDLFYNNMLAKYGVKYPYQMDTHKEKIKQTCNIKWGVDTYFVSDTAKLKMLDLVHKYDINANHMLQVEFFKEKSRKTCMSNHGVEYPAQSKEIFAKVTKSLLENHEVDSPMKSSAIRNTHRKACIESLGVESPMKSKKVVAKYKSNFLEKYGVEYPSQVKFHCGQCNKTSTGISHITRWHKNHKNVSLILANDVRVPYNKHIDNYDN